MHNYGLPFTGGGIVIGSVMFDQFELVGIALGMVLLGAAAIRFGHRRGREIGDA